MADDKLVDHVVTEEDLKNDPDLVKMGIKVGETVQYPAGEEPKSKEDHEAADKDAADKDPEVKEKKVVPVDPKLPAWMRK